MVLANCRPEGRVSTKKVGIVTIFSRVARGVLPPRYSTPLSLLIYVTTIYFHLKSFIRYGPGLAGAYRLRLFARSPLPGNAGLGFLGHKISQIINGPGCRNIEPMAKPIFPAILNEVKDLELTNITRFFTGLRMTICKNW